MRGHHDQIATVLMNFFDDRGARRALNDARGHAPDPGRLERRLGVGEMLLSGDVLCSDQLIGRLDRVAPHLQLEACWGRLGKDVSGRVDDLQDDHLAVGIDRVLHLGERCLCELRAVGRQQDGAIHVQTPPGAAD